ncbi:MAG: hypothetical protein NTX44_03730 [Ignavibacteriales bacterium]|nr:hypothetical protein [Ignavibacteriales bacterium]
MNHSKPYGQNAEGVNLQQIKEEEPSEGSVGYLRNLWKVTKKEAS